MIHTDRFARALSATPEAAAASVEPVLRVLLHDINGALSAITMEAFVIERMASGLAAAEASAARPSSAGAVRDSAQNLRQAADGIAAYLAQVDELVTQLRASRDAS